jgi:hypothetical protein
VKPTLAIGVALLALLSPAAAGAVDLSVPALEVRRGSGSEIAGVRLGDGLADVRRWLEGSGWRVRVRQERRRGVAVDALSASRHRPADPRRLKLVFVGGRAVSIRAYYRHEDATRVEQIERRCASPGWERLGKTRNGVGCIDAGRTVAWRVSAHGRRLDVLDVATLMAKGLVRQKKLERLLAQGRQDAQR